jgi:hypothetical protein
MWTSSTLCIETLMGRRYPILPLCTTDIETRGDFKHSDMSHDGFISIGLSPVAISKQKANPALFVTIEIMPFSVKTKI